MSDDPDSLEVPQLDGLARPVRSPLMLSGGASDRRGSGAQALEVGRQQGGANGAEAVDTMAGDAMRAVQLCRLVQVQWRRQACRGGSGGASRGCCCC